jgi:uncharacterized protein (DUF433 family)
MPPLANAKTKGAKMAIDYHHIITLEAGKRSGKPCIRGLRITVYDVLSWLADGMSREEIIDDFPELNNDDINACLSFAADREAFSNNQRFMKLLLDENLSRRIVPFIQDC